MNADPEIVTGAEEYEIAGLNEIEVFNTAVDEIDSEVVNLILVAIDASGSMGTFISDMQASLLQFQNDLRASKEADEILVARANFSTYIDIGGYKPLDEFDTSYRPSGQTRLYDVIIDCADGLMAYAEFLRAEGFRVKAVFSVFSDGADTYSTAIQREAAKRIADLNDAEITTAFISFGSAAGAEAQALGFKNILKTGADASSLRRAFAVLSRSVVDQSRSVTPNINNFFDV